MPESVYDFAAILNILCIFYGTESEINKREGNNYTAEEYEKRHKIIFEELLQRGIYD